MQPLPHATASGRGYVSREFAITMDGHLRLVTLTVFVAVCSGDWQDGNDGVDRLNGDLLNMPISLKSGASPRDCARFCYANAQCKAWAFSKPNCNGSVIAQCYLKAEITQQSTNPCKVSCIEYVLCYSMC